MTVRALRDADGESLVDLDVMTRNQNGDVVLTGAASARVDA